MDTYSPSAPVTGGTGKTVCASPNARPEDYTCLLATDAHAGSTHSTASKTSARNTVPRSTWWPSSHPKAKRVSARMAQSANAPESSHCGPRTPRLTAMIRSVTSDKIQPYTDLDTMLADHNLRYTTTAVTDEPALAPRSAIRQAIGEVVRSAAGIGWSPFLRAALWASVLGILVAATETDSPTTEPAASTVALLQALGRFVLVADEQVTMLVVLGLVACFVASVWQVSVRLGRGAASSAVGRLVRHQLTGLLRMLIWPLVFVAAYCIFHGTLPASDTIIWIGLFVLISSWTSGGTLYHLTTSLTARMKLPHTPSPIRSDPTLRELIESAKRRSHQRWGIGPSQ